MDKMDYSENGFINFTAVYFILDFLHETPNFSAQLCSVRMSKNYDPIAV